jgi:hypothetical protein
MMKKAALAAAFAGCASAFTAPMHGIQRMHTQRSAAMRPALRMQASTEDQEIADAKAKMTGAAGAQFEAKDTGAQPVATGGTQYASPEAPAPLFLIPNKSVVGDGKMVGDKGFDPLGLADSNEKLAIYREAELKHGRLAMLAAAGWPISELVPHGSDSILQTTAGRAPSVLNGGLGEVNPLFWLTLLLFFANLENGTLEYQFSGWQSTGKPWKYVAGDYGFDPLNLQDAIADKWIEATKGDFSEGDDRDPMTMKADVKANVAKAEMWHGRVAMLAITGFAVQEAVWGTPVVDQSPIFFATPVWHLLQEIF